MKKLLVLIFAFMMFVNFSYAYTGVSGAWTDIFSGIQRILEIIYLFFWPLLFIASKLLSNDWVFGGTFHLDVILWKLWQAVRVFANYFVGFVFLISIFVYFFKSESGLSWKKIFPKIVIAAVLVNLSWFLIGALLDISSLLIVAFGDLAAKFKKQVAKVGTDKEAQLTYLPTIYSGGTFYVEYNGHKYQPCIYQLNKNLKTITKPSNPPCFTFEGGKYKLYNSANSVSVTGGIAIQAPKNLVLFSFFRYLYNQFFVNTVQVKGALAVIFLSKLFIWFILLVPLITLIVILVIRLVILWLFIPFSPLLIAAHILGLVPGEYKGKLTEIIGLIFQPAYVMFMLGIGFVLLEAVYQMEPKKTEVDKSQLAQVLDYKLEDNGKRIVIGGNLVMEGTNNTNGEVSDNLNIKHVFEYFDWFVINLIAGFVLWALVFTALKSNKFTEKIATAVDTYAKKTFETIPILPGHQSIASLQQTWSTVSTQIPSQKIQKEYINLGNAFKHKNENDTNQNNNNQNT